MKKMNLLLALCSLFATVALAQDLAVVAPQHTRVLVENDKVRVLEFSAKADDKIPLHSHPDMVIYVLQGGKRRFTSADGTVTDSNPQAGTAAIRGEVTHSEEVYEDFKAILVEMKK